MSRPRGECGTHFRRIAQQVKPASAYSFSVYMHTARCCIAVGPASKVSTRSQEALGDRPCRAGTPPASCVGSCMSGAVSGQPARPLVWASISCARQACYSSRTTSPDPAHTQDIVHESYAPAGSRLGDRWCRKSLGACQEVAWANFVEVRVLLATAVYLRVGIALYVVSLPVARQFLSKRYYQVAISVSVCVEDI